MAAAPSSAVGKRRWSSERRHAARTLRNGALVASGRLLLSATACDYCHRYGQCEVDPNDETSTPYCSRCWAEWTAQMVHREQYRPSDKAGPERQKILREHLQTLRQQLFHLLDSAADGVVIDEVPMLLRPFMECDGTTLTSIDLRSMWECSADFVQEERRGAGRDGSSSWIVLKLADHIRAHIYERRRGAAQHGIPSGTVLHAPRILLILDLNHLLCERHSYSAPQPVDDDLRSHPHTFVKPGKSLVWERPYAASFVDWCMAHFTVAIWSSGKRRNIEPIVQQLFTNRRVKHMLFIWCQEQCVIEKDHFVSDPRSASGRKPLIRKDLSSVWRKWLAWDQTSTVLVDDDFQKCAQNPPHTAIHPQKWYALDSHASSTNELAPDGPLCKYLGALSQAANSQSFITESPYTSPAST